MARADRKRGPRDWERWNHFQKHGVWPKSPLSAAQGAGAKAPQKPANAPRTAEQPKVEDKSQPTLFDMPNDPAPRYYGNLD